MKTSGSQSQYELSPQGRRAAAGKYLDYKRSGFDQQAEIGVLANAYGISNSQLRDLALELHGPEILACEAYWRERRPRMPFRGKRRRK
jgi:hypothetical protein